MCDVNHATCNVTYDVNHATCNVTCDVNHATCNHPLKDRRTLKELKGQH